MHHTSSFDHDDSLEDTQSLVEVSPVAEPNKQISSQGDLAPSMKLTPSKGDLVPPASLALSNSFASLPIMDDIIPQEKNYTMHNALDQSQAIHV